MKDKKLQVRHVSIPEDGAGQRIDNFLLRELKGVPRSHVYRLLRTGQVRVNGGRIKPDHRLAAGDAVRLPPVSLPGTPVRGAPSKAQRAWVADAIRHEDDYVLVVDKPAGIAVHGGSGIGHGVIEVLRALRPEATLELAHRLDRETSGCLLVAKRRAALRRLHAAFREGKVEKRYLALLAGRWAHGRTTVGAALKRNLLQGGERMVRVVDDGGKAARTEFRPLTLYAGASYMEIVIDTGRTHQIRVHAAHSGHPVIGDGKYGDDAVNKRFRARGLKRMFLHAHGLTLPHPSGQGELSVEAPLPDELRAVLTQLEAQ